MDTPKWITWAGLAAIVGGLMAIILTPPFATAYFSAYPGFALLLIVVIWMARSEGKLAQKKNTLIPAIAAWKIPLLIIMTLANMGVMGILTYIAFRHKVKFAAAGFIVAFLCLVGM